MKNKHVLTFIFVALAVLVFSCSGDKQEKSGKITIIYSGNIGGETGPCGCEVSMGGLPRRHTLLNELRSKDPDLVVLDSGGMLNKQPIIIPPNDKVPPLKEAHVFNTVLEMGIDAVNISPLDLAKGLDFFREMDNKAPGVWISSNIIDRETGKLAFTPHKIIQKNGLDIGVFGLMAPAAMGVPFFDSSHPLNVLDPVETARKKVKELKKSSDIVVALVYMDPHDAEILAEKVPGIQVIIISHAGEHTPVSASMKAGPILAGSTILVRVTDGGRILGRLDLEMVKGSADFRKDIERADLRPAVAGERTLEQSVYNNEFYELTPVIKENEEIVKKNAEVTATCDSIRAELAKSKK
jgi:2',3'-cyclic-nucleotide 2'-phosphodiesterase (5'-nucleotidase family)